LSTRSTRAGGGDKGRSVAFPESFPFAVAVAVAVAFAFFVVLAAAVVDAFFLAGAAFGDERRRFLPAAAFDVVFSVAMAYLVDE
jgi:hypothetical protein